MSSLCQTIDEVDNWWMEFEKALFSDVDRRIQKEEIDLDDLDAEIHLLKSNIGEELISENHKLSDIFFGEYFGEGMPVNVIKQFFWKKYDSYISTTNDFIERWKKKEKISKLKAIADNELKSKGFKRDSYFEVFTSSFGIGCYAVPIDKPYYLFEDETIPKDGEDHSEWFEWNEADL